PNGELSYTPIPDGNGTATITITASDDGGTANGGIDTTTTTATITITPVNDVPILALGADLTVAEDAGPQAEAAWATTVPGPADEAGQTISYTVSNDNPTLFTTQPSIAPNGELSYTPIPDGNGTATITITASDDGGTANGGQDTAAATATITVTPVNDDPVGVDDARSIDEDDLAGITFDVLTNDSDVDGDTPQYASAVLSTVVGGTITDNADGTFDYVPDENFNGVETFVYTLIDGNGGSDTATVTITVNPLPDAPSAGDDARVTVVDTPLSVPAPGVLANDYDVDGEALTVNTTPVTPPANGALTLNADGSYLYTPNAAWAGTDSFTYEVADPGGSTDTATVTITVDTGSVNQVFYLGDSGSTSWLYDLVSTVPPSTVPPFDSDGDGDPGLTIDKSYGSEFELNSAKYQLWAHTATAPLELDGPVVLDLWATTKNYNINDNGHPYVYLYDCLGFACTKLAEADLHLDPFNDGVADFVNRPIDLGSVTHTVPTGRALVVKLLFNHADAWIGMTADYPSALNLTLANQDPTAVDDALAVDEDATTTNIAVLANDSDADIDPTSVGITIAASLGTATPVGDGTIDYTPNPDANGVDSFDYQVCDLGGNCATATVTVTITPVNDQPTFTGGGNVVSTGPGANSFAGWATAIDVGAANESSQNLTFTVTANDNPGQFSVAPSIDPITGELTFTALAGPATANLTIELSDDGGTANGGVDTSTSYGFTITFP
ncbi:MAG: cadherin-like domain-containing protein, partial [Acidimicrobiales bacterium]